MSIVFDENLDLFRLETANTSYIIGLADHRTFVGHVYYGRRVRRQDLRYLLRTGEAPFVPSENERERCSFYDTFPSEYSGNGVGDYRESSIAVRTQAGQHAVMRPMSLMKLQIRNQTSGTVRLLLTGRIPHRH